MKLRVIAAIALAFVALSIFRDPYTHYLNGSDVLLPAPVWQPVAGLLDIGLLITAIIFVLRASFSHATKVLATEFLYAIALNLILVHRDGIGRVIWGFGAERHTIDFIVVSGLRALILLALLQPLRHRAGRAA
jgi:hypothetical protein